MNEIPGSMMNIADIEKQPIVKGDVELPDGGMWDIRKDKYSRARGGNPEMLLIGCSECEFPVIIYQKDGPGPLKRCYIDRIAYVWGSDGNKAPEPIDSVHETGLNCPHCQQKIGQPMIYEKENRLAVKMGRGKFAKSKYTK